MTQKTKLPPKQEALCREYMVDRCGAQAAIRAGYSKNGAAETAYRVLSSPKGKARIAELEAEYLEAAKGDAVTILRHALMTMTTGLDHFLEVDPETGQVKRINLAKAGAERLNTLSEITIDQIGETTTRTKIKLGDRGKALDKLWPLVGLDKTEKATEADALGAVLDALMSRGGSPMPMPSGDDEAEV